MIGGRYRWTVSCGCVVSQFQNETGFHFCSMHAAAPELLEALERLLDNGNMPHFLSGRDPTVREEDIGPARAAIAKARGKQEAAQANPGRSGEEG